MKIDYIKKFRPIQITIEEEWEFEGFMQILRAARHRCDSGEGENLRNQLVNKFSGED